MYDAALGRFLERDPLEQVYVPNLYESFAGNPTDLADPSGLWPFAWRTFFIRDPFVVESQGEWLHAIIGTLKVSIYDVDPPRCTYKVEITISSDVPEQQGLEKKWAAGANVKTEYFLRQLYEKEGAKLTPRYSSNLIRQEETTFLKQSWKMPRLDNLEALRKNIIDPGKQGSQAHLRAVFRMSDKDRGEGWAVVSMTGFELGAVEAAVNGGFWMPRPEPLTKEYPMRELNIKWAFDVKRRWASIAFIQPGKPVWRVR